MSSRYQSWFDSTDYGAQARDQSTLSRVLGLLGVASIFTALGAIVGPSLGVIGLWIGLIGGLVMVFALRVVRERAPLNLILLIVFATLEGVVLGDVLVSYIASGLSVVVVQAAAATAVAALAAGVIGYTTHRDLSGLGGFLMVALIIVIVASVIGLFVHTSFVWTAISAVSAVLFAAFLVYDLNRVARTQGATQGQAIMLAVSVYLDIFNLFLDLLSLLSSGRRS